MASVLVVKEEVAQDGEVPLDEELSRNVQAAAKSLRAANRQSMAELTQLCALLLQMRIGWLTVVMIVLTVLVALDPLLQVIDWTLAHVRNLLTCIDG